MDLRRFEHQGNHLSYEDHGSGARCTVLMHGLLLDAGVNRALARAMASAGHRVVLLDLLGHGQSDKPRRAGAYRMDFFADQVVALLDHLELDEAVIGGVSLGADVALMTADGHPERTRGLIIEMPVLEHATPFAALLFVPILLAMHYGGPVARLATTAMARLPRTGMETFDSFMNAVSLHPAEITSVLHGILMGPLGPTEERRAQMSTPALIIGHSFDPLHPETDAVRLARQMPNARMVKARSFAELRYRPERLTDEILRFVDGAWTARPVSDAGVTQSGG
ncbi:MAG: alpha/beta fold hydrolase [Euzebya sp.]